MRERGREREVSGCCSSSFGVSSSPPVFVPAPCPGWCRVPGQQPVPGCVLGAQRPPFGVPAYPPCLLAGLRLWVGSFCRPAFRLPYLCLPGRLWGPLVAPDLHAALARCSLRPFFLPWPRDVPRLSAPPRLCPCRLAFSFFWAPRAVFPGLSPLLWPPPALVLVCQRPERLPGIGHSVGRVLFLGLWCPLGPLAGVSLAPSSSAPGWLRSLPASLSGWPSLRLRGALPTPPSSVLPAVWALSGFSSC